MRTIKARPITAESFRPYGSFASMTEPTGNCFPGEATIYPDQVRLSVSGAVPVTFSPLAVKKPRRMVVTEAEYHSYTAEGVFVIDDDAVIHVAPPSKGEIVPECTEAFIVPKGTLVTLNAGVWHLAALPIHNDVLHVMIILPERVYANDLTLCKYPEDRQVEITL
ncbi:MAG: ureidoglycolate lyase [Clostridia bacterium]|nr:ureidoglycolate lyase [Clostridia bacterium]